VSTLRVDVNKIPQEKLDDITRLFWSVIWQRGLFVEDLAQWRSDFCWFPHLRDSEAVQALWSYLDVDGIRCEPQILWQLPDPRSAWDMELTPHQDQEPPWAEGRKYKAICGVPLTPFTPENGGIWVWSTRDSEPEPVRANPGDVICFDKETWHSNGINKTGQVRMAVYYRFLEER